MPTRLARAAACLALLAGCAVVAGSLYQQTGLRRDHDRFPPPGTFVEVDGRKMFLRCVGHGSPTVIIISGGGTPAVPSFDVQDRIARHTRACSYDRAGLGWSDPAPGRRSLVDATDDLEGVLAKGRVDGSVVLVPESFGGLIALSFLARAPSRVAGAVFVDASEPTLWFGRAERSVASWRLHNLWWGPAVDLGLVRALFPYLAPDWVRRLPEPRRDLFRAVYSRPTRGYGESANAVATAKGDQPVDLPGAMADRPLIVLEHGRPSAALPAMWESGWPAAQRRLAMLSTQGRLVVVADAGHAIAEEDPATVAAAVATVVDAARQRLRPPAP